MDFTKRVQITLTDNCSGKVLGQVHKDIYLSDNPNITLDGNQFLERWLSCFVRGASRVDNISLLISAQDITIPAQSFIPF